MTRRGEPNYGIGVHEMLESEAGKEPAELIKCVSALFEAPSYRPPLLPAVALEVMALSSRPNVDLGQVADVIEKDVMLAAQVMRLAGSAMYAGSFPVRTIRDALVRFGLNTVRDMVILVATTTRVFHARGYDDVMERIRTHSQATAHYARIVAMQTSLDSEYVFLCGLLHDIGLAAVLIALAEEASLARRSVPDIAPLVSTIMTVHEHVGAIICGRWRLPEEIKLVVGYHHLLRVDGHVHPVIATLRMAEHLALEGGHTIFSTSAGIRIAWETPNATEFLEACRSLSVTPAQLQSIRDAIAKYEEAAGAGT